MFPSRLTFVALAVACVAAAAGGGYLAVRQNTVPAPVAAQPASPSATTAPAVTTPAPSAQAAAPLASEPAAAAPAPTAPKADAPQKSEVPADAPRSESARPATTASTARTTRAAANRPPQPLPTDGRPWPAGAEAQPPALPPSAPSASTTDQLPAPMPSADAQSGARGTEPQKSFDELTVAADSVIGLQTETPVTSESARVEDRVEARVSRDVRVGDKVAIPAGTRAIGSVVSVDRGGKFRERARLGVRFHTLLLADGTRLPISTDTIYREGTAPGNESAAKIGAGAVGGAILGAILGGGRGAAIGAATGSGAGAAVVAAGDRNAATLPAGTPTTVRLLSPVTVTVEQK